MRDIVLRLSAATERSPFRRLVLRRLGSWLMRCHDRHRQRLDLAELDDDRLRDLGLTREDVRRECAKSFWRF